MTTAQPIHAELIAVVVAVNEGIPRVLTLRDGSALPAGPLEAGHRSLQAGLRHWVERQTGHRLGHIEQLYTFADATRSRAGRSISICYLALTSQPRTALDGAVSWQDWYQFFPWEDRRNSNAALESAIRKGLTGWSAALPARQTRAAYCFGLNGAPWHDDAALARYELLYEAGLVREALRDGVPPGGDPLPGAALAADHRRIVATAISRLRATIRYRPLVAELMPPEFTLSDLQLCIEAIAGQTVHKGNFRRMIEAQKLLVPTGTTGTTAGRPARLFRFDSADAAR